VVESVGLLNRCTGQTVPQVRILSSPLNFKKLVINPFSVTSYKTTERTSIGSVLTLCLFRFPKIMVIELDHWVAFKSSDCLLCGLTGNVGVMLEHSPIDMSKHSTNYLCWDALRDCV
jgi:hypothetical protein